MFPFFSATPLVTNPFHNFFFLPVPRLLAKPSSTQYLKPTLRDKEKGFSLALPLRSQTFFCSLPFLTSIQLNGLCLVVVSSGRLTPDFYTSYTYLDGQQYINYFFLSSSSFRSRYSALPSHYFAGRPGEMGMWKVKMRKLELVVILVCQCRV